ncbi:uncharacterized protein LOC103708983 [Phoenix dactylifera]|uniref:Uncharacterized protein LOC103708983 n=1 Tax=Phoenix dactylifera TaxID=42345 RepID=A0A8B7C5Z0_PHODC|nr:uncharacterized protein LOC103708983 [Phoenix dactylifera]
MRRSLFRPPPTRSLPRLSFSPILISRSLPRLLLRRIASDEGIGTCNMKSSNMKETEGLRNQSKEEEVSQITEANASMLSDKLVPGTAGKGSLGQDAAYLSLGQVGTTNSSANVGCITVSECTKETSGSCFPAKVDEEREHNKLNSVGIGVDLNAIEVSSMVEQNPFYPYKKLGQVKSVDASESGSTTGPVEESEPLRIWKEMKQNGFLSSSHGGIPMPKQRACQPRKRKDEFRRKAEFARREQANRFTKIAAPSGLLSGLNPGIINHVRNSKQVHSIIEAIVRSEKLDGQTQNRFTDQMGSESNDTNDRRKPYNYAHGSATNQLNLSLNKLSVPSSLDRGVDMHMAEDKFRCEISTTQFSTKDDNDALTLKLSSAITETSENASGASTDYHSANQDNITSLSLKAATVSSQWLDLLQQDIKGRLAALRRSRRRVRNVIQTELPYLLSTEFSFSQENDPSFVHSSEAQCLKKPSQEMHVARWRSLFSQMDKALYEEGKHLENWLKQVQEMQLHCQKGLNYVCVEGLSKFGSSEDSSKLKKSEAHEQEYAVRAAAASIYSTCNLIMTTENVPCF